MSIAPKYLASHIFKPNPSGHQVYLFLDYNCPFSAKLFLNWKKDVIPTIEAKFPGKFQFVFLNVIQPWHPQSTILHEVSFAVGQIAPEKFLDYATILFENKEDFYDTATYNETRNQLYQKLAKLAEDELDISASKILDLVEIKPIKTGEAQNNNGASVVKDVKYFTRFHRTLGVHVTPTIAVDGIINGAIESSTSTEKLAEIFQSYL